MTASQVNGMPTAFPPPPPPPQPQGAPTHSLTHQTNPYQSTPGQPMYGAHANNGQFEPYSTQTSQIVVVDMFSGFHDGYLADDIHYNNAGAKFIAYRYFQVLEQIMMKNLRQK